MRLPVKSLICGKDFYGSNDEDYNDNDDNENQYHIFINVCMPLSTPQLDWIGSESFQPTFDAGAMLG